MNCPSCNNSATNVIDKRDVDIGAIRRRRGCDKCHYRFTTYERVQSVKLQVVKKDGSIRPYDRSKIAHGIKLATEKRGISDTQIGQIINHIERSLIGSSEPIPTIKIGRLVLKELKGLDQVAYLRFSSVYKDFTSIKSFEKELAKLVQPKKEASV